MRSDQHHGSLGNPAVYTVSVLQACTHLFIHTLKTGTTSVWEFSKIEGSDGLVPGQVSTVIT